MNKLLKLKIPISLFINGHHCNTEADTHLNCIPMYNVKLLCTATAGQVSHQNVTILLPSLQEPLLHRIPASTTSM